MTFNMEAEIKRLGDEVVRLREALAEERERCAQVADKWGYSDVAVEIRALKDEPIKDPCWHMIQ
jgi:hypothetical protein